MENKPKRIIEIGSGNSTKVIVRALSDCGIKCEYTVIDPYSIFNNDSFDGYQITVINSPVEEVSIERFRELASGDILFIDSSHCVRIGGDVNFEILEILPILNNGVNVHFHDIPMPYEYGKTYYTNPQFRVFWTEAYMLQAFLCFNTEYEITLPMAYLLREHFDECHALFPNMIITDNYHSESFWICKKNSKRGK